MAFAIPSKITKIYRKYFSTKKTDKIVGKIYYKYLKTITKTYCYLKYDKKNIAPFKPLKIYYINPNKIKKPKNPPQFHSFLPTIRGGDWDKNTHSIEETLIFQSFQQHFEQGKDWEETDFYQEKKRELEIGNSQYNRNSNRNIDEVMEDIDSLYSSIEENGFKEQEDLERTIAANKTFDHHLREFNEIKIMYSRNGTPLISSGHHRTIIAKLLDIDKIPVRVKAKHKEWQEVRNQAVKNPEKLTKKQKQHPDIKNLIN